MDAAAEIIFVLLHVVYDTLYGGMEVSVLQTCVLGSPSWGVCVI